MGAGSHAPGLFGSHVIASGSHATKSIAVTTATPAPMHANQAWTWSTSHVTGAGCYHSPGTYLSAMFRITRFAPAGLIRDIGTLMG